MIDGNMNVKYWHSLEDDIKMEMREESPWRCGLDLYALGQDKMAVILWLTKQLLDSIPNIRSAPFSDIKCSTVRRYEYFLKENL